MLLSLLVFAEEYEREKQVQGWSRAKREALIRGDYDDLPTLARKDFEKHRKNHIGADEPKELDLA